MNTCYNPFSLAGKTILVTGASSGIGRSITIECSKMGATVIAAGRNIERLNETLAACEGSSNSIVTGDLSNQEDIDNIVKSLPKLDGVVLCAGIGNATLIPFATPEKIRKIYDVNFFAQIELLRLLVKKKLLVKESSVVAMSSVGGYSLFSFAHAIYGSAKAALRSFMKFASKEFANKKIRVNSICPGMIDTPLIHKGVITEEQLKEDEKLYPLGRYGKPEDVAYCAVYLLSNAANWVTGSTFVIDGGVSNI